MLEVTITMSQKELSRLEAMQKIKGKILSQKKAAKLLSLSKRQIIRLYERYKKEGANGLISKRRGKPSNHRLSEKLYDEVTGIIRERYYDFGPTLTHEKLTELHQIYISRETIRQWMIRAKIWKGKNRKYSPIHQMRNRRDCFGELVQIDGSPHAWFEDRGPECCLIVFIDDATSRLVSLLFAEGETTFAYFKALRLHLTRHGRPVTYYSDRNSIFRTNRPETLKEVQTQFERALKELGITIINANSPQAKGRVEKANSTLQDRLIKEMRLRGINNIDEANKFLPEFIEDYNCRFAVEAKNKTDAHRKIIPQPEVLDLILCLKEHRILSKNLELSYKNSIYQIQVKNPSYVLRGSKVTICEDENGRINILYKNKQLVYKKHDKQKRAADIISSKDLNKKVDKIIQRNIVKPKENHPWRQYKLIREKQKNYNTGAM